MINLYLIPHHFESTGIIVHTWMVSIGILGVIRRPPIFIELNFFLKKKFFQQLELVNLHVANNSFDFNATTHGYWKI